VNQCDEPGYIDYSSFGSGPPSLAHPEGCDRDASEAQCRANYQELVEKLTKYERALEVTNRINEDGINIQNGENTFIFNAEIDNGAMYAAENSEEAELLKVRYSSLLTILIMEAVGLSEHDKYVCHNYRDPFRYRVIGYRQSDVCDGRIVTPVSTPQPQASVPNKSKYELSSSAEVESKYEVAADSKSVEVSLSGLPTMGTSVMLKEDIDITAGRTCKPRCGVWGGGAEPIMNQDASTALGLDEGKLPTSAPGLEIDTQSPVTEMEASISNAPSLGLDVNVGGLELEVLASNVPAVEVDASIQDGVELEIPASDTLVDGVDSNINLGIGLASVDVSTTYVTKPPSQQREEWCVSKRDTCQTYFDRYDLDDSGTINSVEEMKYLTINLVKANSVPLGITELDAIMTTNLAIKGIGAGAHMTLDNYMVWFYDEIIQREQSHIDI